MTFPIQLLLACVVPLGGSSHSPVSLQSTAGAGVSLAPGAGSQALVGSADDCSNPYVIGAAGFLPFDLSNATTGTEGQVCAGTLFDDVWFRWTSFTTGTAVISTCNTASFDTVLAAYPGNSCPVNGSAITCKDNACGLQSAIRFPVSLGTEYMIQLGTAQPGVGGVGTLSFVVTGFPRQNDDCATPGLIFGEGSFPYNPGEATTGSQGQNCSVTLNNDLWFNWTPDATGLATICTCASDVFWQHGAGCLPREHLSCTRQCPCVQR